MGQMMITLASAFVVDGQAPIGYKYNSCVSLDLPDTVRDLAVF